MKSTIRKSHKDIGLVLRVVDRVISVLSVVGAWQLRTQVVSTFLRTVIHTASFHPKVSVSNFQFLLVSKMLLQLFIKKTNAIIGIGSNQLLFRRFDIG